jgi:hypothetical protein
VVLRNLRWVELVWEFRPWDRSLRFFCYCIQFRPSFCVWWLVVVPWLLPQHIQVGSEPVSKLRFLARILQLATAVVVIDSDRWYVLLAEQVTLLFVLELKIILLSLCQKVSCIHFILINLIQIRLKDISISIVVSKDVFRPRAIELMNMDVLNFFSQWRMPWL